MKKYKTQDAIDIVLGKRESSFKIFSIVPMRNIPQIIRELENSFLSRINGLIEISDDTAGLPGAIIMDNDVTDIKFYTGKNSSVSPALACIDITSGFSNTNVIFHIYHGPKTEFVTIDDATEKMFSQLNVDPYITISCGVAVIKSEDSEEGRDAVSYMGVCVDFIDNKEDVYENC